MLSFRRVREALVSLGDSERWNRRHGFVLVADEGADRIPFRVGPRHPLYIFLGRDYADKVDHRDTPRSP